MPDWLSVLLAAVAVGFLGVRILLKPILAFTTKPDADFTRIKANFEGPLGEAGPSMRVVDIVPTGGTLPTRSRDAERSYRVTLKTPDGRTEQKTVRIQVALLGEGQMTLDREPRPSRTGPARAAERSGIWWRLPAPLRVALAMGLGLAVFAGLNILPALPLISDAKEQLGYVLHRTDIHIVQLYGGGRECGVYETARDHKPMAFMIENGQVWATAIEPQGVRQDAPFYSADPYDRWSSCVSYAKGGRHDESLALWVLGLFRRTP